MCRVGLYEGEFVQPDGKLEDGEISLCTDCIRKDFEDEGLKFVRFLPDDSCDNCGFSEAERVKQCAE